MLTQTKKIVKISRNANTELAHNLVREYKQTRWVQNSERIGKPDTLSARYSIQEMEEFLAVAKKNGGDGIKFYFGAYPEYFASNPDYSGRQTLVLVATKSKITGTGEKAVKDIYIRKNGKAEIVCGILPEGCPPRCSRSNEGGMGDLGITIVDKGSKGMEIV